MRIASSFLRERGDYIPVEAGKKKINKSINPFYFFKAFPAKVLLPTLYA